MNEAAKTLPELVDRARACQAAGALMMVRPSELPLLLGAAAQATLYDLLVDEIAAEADASGDRPTLIVNVFATGRPLPLELAKELLPEALERVRDQVLRMAEPEFVQPPCDVEA